MALDQSLRNGVLSVSGSYADIEADRIVSKIVVGRLYVDLTNNKQGRGISNGNTVDPSKTDLIRWEVLVSDIDAAVLVETNARIAAITAEETARIAADETNATAIAAETTARIAAITAEEVARDASDVILQGMISTEGDARANADTLLQNNIDAEVLRATTREDEIETAYIASDAALETALTTAFQNAMDAYADKDVRSLIKAAYADGATLSVATLLGATPVDGVHAIFCTSTSLSNTATMTSPVALATGEEVVDFGDTYHVTVDGGVVTAVVKVDSILKAKFDSLDSSITDLNAATTATAIRSHFTQAGWVTITNGEIKVVKSTQGGNDIIDGTDGFAYLSVGETPILYLDDTQTQGDSSVNVVVSDIYAKLANISSSLVQADNGLSLVDGNVEMGGALTKPTAITGDFSLDMAATNVVNLPYATFLCYDSTYNATTGGWTRTTKASTGQVEMWFDVNGDPKFTFVPN